MKNKAIIFAEKLIKENKSFVAATVKETLGSTPRKTGALLIMDEEGNQEGTVGGGRIEAEGE